VKVLTIVLVVALVASLGTYFTALTVCPTEDSTHCIWYGPLQGNRSGNIVINW
jgi:hypothetical protein